MQHAKEQSEIVIESMLVLSNLIKSVSDVIDFFFSISDFNFQRRRHAVMNQLWASQNSHVVDTSA